MSEASLFLLLIPLALTAWYRPRWAVLVLLAGLSAYVVRTSVTGLPTTWLELGIYITFIIWLARGGWHELKAFLPRLPLRWAVPLVLWLVAGLVGVLVASDTRLAAGVFKGFMVDPWLLLLMVAAAALAVQDSLRWWRDCLAALMAGAVSTTSAALAQSWLMGLERLQSGYDSPNTLAMYLAPILVAGVLWLIWPAGRASLKPWARYAWAAACVVLSLGVVGTNSYAALVAVAGALVLAGVGKYWPRLVLPLGVGLIIVSVLLPFITVANQRALLLGHTNPTYGVTSAGVRLVLWQEATAVIARQPWFGLGLGQWQPHFTAVAQDKGYLSIVNPGLAIELHYSSLYPHNVWLTTWLAAGALGLLALIWLSVQTLGGVRLGMLIPAAALTVQVLHGSLDTPLWRNDLSVLWWLPMAVVLVAVMRRQLGEEATV